MQYNTQVPNFSTGGVEVHPDRRSNRTSVSVHRVTTVDCSMKRPCEIIIDRSGRKGRTAVRVNLLVLAAGLLADVSRRFAFVSRRPRRARPRSAAIVVDRETLSRWPFAILPWDPAGTNVGSNDHGVPSLDHESDSGWLEGNGITRVDVSDESTGRDEQRADFSTRMYC